jgi:hypothetical protein
LDATIEAFRMIDPPSVKSGSAFCTVKSNPLTLMLKILSKCSSVIDPSGMNAETPALANRTSRRPCCCLTVANSRSRSLEVRDVALHAGDVPADLLYRSIEFRLPASGDEDVGALGDEPPGGGQADAAVAPGNDRGLTFQFLRNGTPPLPVRAVG